MKFNFFKFNSRSAISGFNLMELMVTVGILAIINMMIFASYPEFSQRMALKRTSEEIALIVRQAQSYALGIKRPASGGDDYFGFGVHFETSNPKVLILFADSDGKMDYDAGGGCGSSNTECFQKFTIDTKDVISELHTYNSLDSPSPVKTLDIVYPRATSIATISGSNTSYAKVTIKSPRGNLEKNKKYIKIWISGQISVE